MSPLVCPHCKQSFTLAAVALHSEVPAAVLNPPAMVSIDPSAPHWFCPIHRQSKIVPAGVSKKTGKAYAAFWACSESGCDERPPRGYPVPGAPRPGVPVAVAVQREEPEFPPLNLDELA